MADQNEGIQGISGRDRRSCFFSQPAMGDPLLVLGKHARMKRTIIVSPGATDTDSGDNLKSALDSVKGTAETPHLIKIEPGIYDLGTSSLIMKPYVDIEGSGQGITTITTNSQAVTGVVTGSSNAGIRELTLINTVDGESVGYGLYISYSSPTVRNVTIDVTNGCNNPFGIYIQEGSTYSVFNNDSDYDFSVGATKTGRPRIGHRQVELCFLL